MVRILLVSHNEVLLEDLQQQFKYHEGWDVKEQYDEQTVYDAVVIDDDLKMVEKLINQLHYTSIFLLWSGEDICLKKNNLHIVCKPFYLQKLIDDIHLAFAVLPDKNSLELFGCCLNITAREICYPNRKEKVKLTEREVSILKYLYKAGDKIVSKTELLAEVWGYNPEATTHTVETHIYRLRQKIEQDGKENQIILTQDNGYKLRPAIK